jgi:hypothetical protein
MSDPIDFDSWQALARSNPKAFEAKRRALVDDVIRRVPEPRQHRLRCLQWRIEKVCAKANNPISASLALSNMMWESVGRQQNIISRLFEEPDPDTSPTGPGARVLPFPRKSP